MLQTAVALASPRNLIEIILHGIEPVEGEPGEMMPGFADVLTDKQIAELAAYVRSRFGDGPAWSNIEDVVRGIRNGR
ncbi:MAG: cytochrome c [Methylobacteriaceae bacterium]|nr:cytochrome c [Methylobacteriaceae bacterium]